MNPEIVTPYEMVFKDDFTYTECVTDGIFLEGDKFGDGKFNYKIEDRFNVSIMHYTDMIPSEDQEPMSQKVCFDFCRTVPSMGFFSLINGRDCYCTPFYNAIAGDSSECTSTCEGAPIPAPGMCGGKSKSAMFEMHMCASTGTDLAKALEDGATFEKAASGMAKDTMGVASEMQVSAASQQEMWGQVGDPAAAELMQGAKAWAGDVMHAGEALDATNAELAAFMEEGGPLSESGDFASSSAVQEAEALMGSMSETVARGQELYDAAQKAHGLSTRGMGAEGRGAEYYPIMYFVDKEYEAKPSTCGGTTDGHPIFGVTMEECAAACNTQKADPDCTGFFHSDSMCILIAKFKSVTYYTGCSSSSGKSTEVPKCYAKLQKYQGTSLAPDASGKCDHCLKEATKADRCYE